MAFIKNIFPGACASITFYQFVKYSDKLRINDIKLYMKDMKNELGNEPLRYLNSIEPVINKYWRNIKFGYAKFKDLPCGNNLCLLKKPISYLKIYGESEYGHISFFCRLMYLIETGLWIQDLSGMNVNNLKLNVNKKFLNKYEEMVNKCKGGYYTIHGTKSLENLHDYQSQRIPYITYMIYVDDGKISDEFHVFITLKISDNEYEIYDSNNERKLKINKLVLLWLRDGDEVYSVI